MFGYTPKLYDAVVMVLLLILCLIGGTWVRGRILLALNIGSIIFAVIFAVIMILIVLESLNRRVEVQTEWMQAFGKLDDEARAAVAFQFPMMRYRMKRGVVREYFEDTNATIQQFHYFLKTSDSKQISPLRYWYTKDQPEWAWNEIKGWLEDHSYVLRDSAAGSHSWLWVGNAWEHLNAYWGAGKKMTDMMKEQVMHAPGYAPPEEENQAFAYETPTPPSIEDVGGG